VHPATGRPTTFYGTVVQSSPALYYLDSGGWFLGPSGFGGIVRLEPPEP